MFLMDPFQLEILYDSMSTPSPQPVVLPCTAVSQDISTSLVRMHSLCCSPHRPWIPKTPSSGRGTRSCTREGTAHRAGARG